MNEPQASAETVPPGAEQLAAVAQNLQEDAGPDSAGLGEADIAGITDPDEYAAAMERLLATPTPQPGNEPAAEEEAVAETPAEPEGTEKEEPIKEPEAAKPPQYRLRPKDDVEARTLELRKQNPDFTLEECLTRAKAELGPKTEGAETEATSELPATLEATESRIAELRAERRKARVDDLDFTRGEDLQDQIDALLEHKSGLREKTQREAGVQAEQARSAMSAAESRAVEFYPDTTNAESALVKKMNSIYADLESTENPLISDPALPFKLAQMAANELGIAPRSKSAAPALVAPPQPVKKAPALPVPPASGNARTTTAPTNPVAAHLARVEAVKDIDELDAELNKFLARTG